MVSRENCFAVDAGRETLRLHVAIVPHDRLSLTRERVLMNTESGDMHSLTAVHSSKSRPLLQVRIPKTDLERVRVVHTTIAIIQVCLSLFACWAVYDWTAPAYGFPEQSV